MLLLCYFSLLYQRISVCPQRFSFFQNKFCEGIWFFCCEKFNFWCEKFNFAQQIVTTPDESIVLLRRFAVVHERLSFVKSLRTYLKYTNIYLFCTKPKNTIMIHNITLTLPPWGTVWSYHGPEREWCSAPKTSECLMYLRVVLILSPTWTRTMFFVVVVHIPQQ